MHDSIYMRHPEWFPFFDRISYKRKWQHALTVADKVVVISERSKQDLIEFFRFDNNKLVQIPPPCDARFYAYQDQLFLQHGMFMQEEYEMPYKVPEQYVLYVGGLHERKNVQLVLRALQQLKDRLSLPLVIVGDEQSTEAQRLKSFVAEHKMGKQVIFLGHVPDAHLVPLYRCAHAFVYPSFYEGFGMPIIEAQFSRIPVITCSGSCLEETAGEGGALIVSPTDTEEMANALEQVATDGALRMDLILKGWENAQQYKQEAVAERGMAVYQQLV